MAAIEAADLRRTYKTHTGTVRRRSKEIEAVRGISFAVEPGELFGLLGPNGAGKTTTIKMLITLLIPTGGSARVLGLDVVRDAHEVRKRIGYVFGGERGVYERLSGYDNLRYFAELYGVPAREQKRRIEELLDLVGLKGREHERAEGYSRGMKQRLHVARGLLHDPEVLFLDEPTVARLRSIDGVTSVVVEDRDQKQLLVVQTSGERELTAPLLAQLDGFEVGRVASREPTLEDAYVSLVTAE